MLNFNDADVEGVDDAVFYSDPNIDDDETESFGDDNLNTEGFEDAILHRPPNIEDNWIDLAEGAGIRRPGVVDHRPTVGDCCSAFDSYAFREQGNYSDTTAPLPDGWMEMLRVSSNYPDHPVCGVLAEEHGYYSVKIDVDPN